MYYNYKTKTLDVDVITISMYMQQSPSESLNVQQFYNNHPPNTLGPQKIKVFFNVCRSGPEVLKFFVVFLPLSQTLKLLKYV